MATKSSTIIETKFCFYVLDVTTQRSEVTNDMYNHISSRGRFNLPLDFEK